jgi:hypothetical protein
MARISTLARWHITSRIAAIDSFCTVFAVDNPKHALQQGDFLDAIHTTFTQPIDKRCVIVRSLTIREHTSNFCLIFA